VGEHVCESGLRVDVAEPGGSDLCEHDCGAIGSALGTGEGPGLSAESQAAQRSFGRIVGQADASVSEEADEPFPELEYVVDRLGDL